MPKLRIIINADDLGGNRSLNDAIFGLMSKRCVTSATLLAAGEAVEEASRISSRFPGCSFGAHLCITRFRPITSHPALAALLDDSGCFDDVAVWKAVPSSALKQAVYEEWVAQVAKLYGLNIPVSHLDSHHHVHTIPWLFGVFKRIQRRFGIRRVRISMNLYDDSSRPSRVLLLKKRVFNFALRWYYHSRTTNAFTALASFAELARAGVLLRARLSSVELMVHPGNPHCDEETALLSTRWQEQWPLPPVELISYNDL